MSLANRHRGALSTRTRGPRIDWFQRVPHAFSAFRTDFGRFVEVESTCQEDLEHRPENLWLLFGVARTRRKQKQNTNAADVSARFKHVWQHAGLQLTAPGLCLPGKD
jgi:hypothetical protein